MPVNLKIIYWNVEDFGVARANRGPYLALSNFIAQVILNVDADIFCLIELRRQAIAARLALLQQTLINASIAAGQTCDWYCDWVPGSLFGPGFGMPYDPNDVDFATQGRNEGYAVFWRQNLDKFSMQTADTIIGANATPPGHPAAANVANTQSGSVRRRVPAGGIAALGGNVLIPGGVGQFTLPAGSTPGPGGITRGGMPVPGTAAGVATAGNLPLNAGDIITAGTQIAALGLRLTNHFPGAALANQPIVIPGNHLLANNVTLPAIGSTYLSRHVLSLVMTSRQVVGGVAGGNYNPAMGAINNWELGLFPATRGANFWNGSRRPAFCTIKVNDGLPAPQSLIPIIMYHSPVYNAPAAMGRLAMSQPLYEAMDGGVAPYAHNTRAIVGGDLNARLDPNAGNYLIYTNTYANGGANCRSGATPSIRANNPPPAMVPVFPPPGVPPTEADNPLNKTSVQLRHPILRYPNRIVLSPLFDHFRRGAIDNIFYRGFTPAQAPHFQFRETLGANRFQFAADVYDLPRAVSDQLPPGGAGIAAGGPPDNFFIPPAILNAFAALPMGNPAILNAAQTLADLNVGFFQTPFGGDPALPGVLFWGPGPAVVSRARRASEFIKLFVSDHLPVIFEMTI